MHRVRVSRLYPEEQRLLRLLSRIHFGTIENLRVRGGRPVLDPLPRITREIRMKGGTPTKAAADDFALKDQVVELIVRLRTLGDGIVRRLDVQGGLPFRMFVVERDPTLLDQSEPPAQLQGRAS